MATCEKCGQELQVGDYPYCPHGTGGGKTITDEIPGGMWIENLGTPEPVFVRSHSERRAIMKANGLREFVRHVPGSPHTTSWATMDPYTMEAAQALVSRERQTTTTSGAPPVNWHVTISDAGTFRASQFGFAPEKD